MQIAKHNSVRVGGRSYKPGQEADLLTEISVEEASRLCRSGSLLGDWSGARGSARARAEEVASNRVNRNPLTKAVRTITESIVAKAVAPPAPLVVKSDEDPDGDQYAKPVQMRLKGGGWYNFFDADDEIVLAENGKPIQVQGDKAAAILVERLNA